MRVNVLKYINILFISLIFILFSRSIAQANGLVFYRSMLFSLPVSILIGLFVEANLVYGYFRKHFKVGALTFRLFLYALNIITILLLIAYLVFFVPMLSPIFEPYINVDGFSWLWIFSGEIFVIIFEALCIFYFLKYFRVPTQNHTFQNCITASILGNTASFITGIIVSIFMVFIGEDLLTAVFVYFMK